MRKSLFIIFLVLLFDQALKFWVKTNMMLGEEIRIADWFIIHFTENNGMAFGLELQGEFGKLALSLFRIVAVTAIGYYLFKISKDKKTHPAFLVSLSLIFAGALGNIIDSAFYGMIFSESDFRVASFLPAEGGYATFLHGKVVDMFYFPVIKGYLPDWVPVWGGDYFIFFRPIFNIADSSITIGVIVMLLFQKKIFAKHAEDKNPLIADSGKME